ncbi:MAG: hypothetical protein KGJ04_06555, partial [Gammaproteobacteria bacterium]|nr:hypothetical protein [Gammaproteobacteria bacterium]
VLAAFSDEFYVFRAGIGLGVIATLGLMLESWRAWRGYYAARKPQVAPKLLPFMTGKPAVATPPAAQGPAMVSPITDKYGASHDEHP